jgi:hypothetical protein
MTIYHYNAFPEVQYKKFVHVLIHQTILSVFESWVSRLKWVIKHERKYDTQERRTRDASLRLADKTGRYELMDRRYYTRTQPIEILADHIKRGDADQHHPNGAILDLISKFSLNHRVSSPEHWSRPN